MSCGSFVLAWYFRMIHAMAAAAEFGPVLVEEHRVVVVAGLVQVMFGQVGGQDRCSVVHQGDVAGLAALPGQGGHGGALEADVPDGEVGEFLDPGGCVVERGEQGRVCPGGWTGRVGRAAGGSARRSGN